jgi:hypothetical protein
MRGRGWLCLAVATALQLAPQGWAQRFVKYADTVAALKAVNTLDAHRAVSVAGYFSAGDGGGGVFVWNTASTASTNYGTIFKGVDGTGSELATGRWLRVIRQNGPMELAWFGMQNSAADHPRITNALALAGHVTCGVPVTISTNVTINQTNTFEVLAGGLLTPSTNVVVGVEGVFLAPLTRCIDTTHWVEGTGVIFTALGGGPLQTRTPVLWLDWWGASPNNSSNPATKEFKAWLYSTAANLATIKRVQGGVYLVDAPLSVSNRNVIEGVGNPQINFAPTNSSVGMFEVASGANDVVISGLQMYNSRISATNTFTNLFGVKVNSDVDRLTLRNNYFHKFNGAGIHIDGGESSAGTLYTMIDRCRFQQIDNSTTNGGNALWPAHAIVATNTVVKLDIINPIVNLCDAAVWVSAQGGTNGGAVVIQGGTIENCGRNGVTASNTVTLITHYATVSDVYLEANQADFGIYYRGRKGLAARNPSLAADYAGTKYTGTMIAVDSIGASSLVGAVFNNCKTNFVATLGTGTLSVRDAWFDIGSGTNEATHAEVLARVVGNVSIWRGGHQLQFPMTYAATTDINFARGDSQTVTLAGDITFTTSQKYQGARATVRVVGDGSSRNFTFPGGWKFLGAAAPASIAANKTARLALVCHGTADSDVDAIYTVEP